jgi:hypothetical protein
MFHTKVVQKIKTHFLCSTSFFTPKIVPFYKKMWKNIVQLDKLQTTYMAHALCMLDNEGYRHTLRMCNTYRFSTVTNVSHMRLNITFIRAMPVLFVRSNGYSHVLVRKFLKIRR